MVHVLDEALLPGVLQLQARYEQVRFGLRRDDERNRTFGGVEREAGVVEHPGSLEHEGSGGALLPRVLRQALPPLLVLGVRDTQSAGRKRILRHYSCAGRISALLRSPSM